MALSSKSGRDKRTRALPSGSPCLIPQLRIAFPIGLPYKLKLKDVQDKECFIIIHQSFKKPRFFKASNIKFH